MISKRSISHLKFCLAFIPVLLLVSCGGLPVSIFSTVSTPVPASPTPQVLVILDTPTAIPPSPTPSLDTPIAIPVLADTPTPVLLDPTPLPTFTPIPTLTATTVPIGGVITFAPWTTAAVSQGTIQPGQVITYTVQATALQPMVLILESPNYDVTLGVRAPDGTLMVDPAKKWSHWQIMLRQTGTYTIQVIGGTTIEAYTLTTKLATLINFPNDTETFRILNGDTYLGYVQSYAFRCSEGQVMTLELSMYTGDAYLQVVGIETGVLLSQWDRLTTWTGTLPKTQMYIVEVIPRDGYLMSYQLKVTIP